MWLARFPAACGLFYVIIALFATGSGDDNAPTSNSSGQAIAAYAATHQAGAFAGLLISGVGFESISQTTAKFKRALVDCHPGVFSHRKAVNRRLVTTCRPAVDTSGTTQTRPDTVRHNMVVLAQGVER